MPTRTPELTVVEGHSTLLAPPPHNRWGTRLVRHACGQAKPVDKLRGRPTRALEVHVELERLLGDLNMVWKLNPNLGRGTTTIIKGTVQPITSPRHQPITSPRHHLAPPPHKQSRVKKGMGHWVLTFLETNVAPSKIQPVLARASRSMLCASHESMTMSSAGIMSATRRCATGPAVKMSSSSPALGGLSAAPPSSSESPEWSDTRSTWEGRWLSCTAILRSTTDCLCESLTCKKGFEFDWSLIHFADGCHLPHPKKRLRRTKKKASLRTQNEHQI